MSDIKRKYKGPMRIALIRSEIEEAIKELNESNNDDLISYYYVNLYYKAQWYGAKNLAEKLKKALENKFSCIESKLEYRAWQARSGQIYKVSDDYLKSWFEAIKKPFGDWSKNEKEEEEDSSNEQ